MIDHQPIGGFFELEIPKGNGSYHPNAIPLTNGRACLALILKNKNFNKVYVPFYCCDALFEPLDVLGIDYEFYHINDKFEINNDIDVKDNELLIYINYFGIKNDYCEHLINQYNDKVIIDNTHCFFSKGYENTSSFTSARKYFGVPDGAYVYFKENSIVDYKENKEISIKHNLLRLVGEQKEAYNEYLKSEDCFNSDVLGISKLSERILSSIDYQKVMNIRERNFKLLHERFEHTNKIDFDGEVSLFCYPLLLDKRIDLSLLHQKGIFIPVLWEDVNKRLLKMGKYRIEGDLVSHMLIVPIDQRLSVDDVIRVIREIEEVIK